MRTFLHLCHQKICLMGVFRRQEDCHLPLLHPLLEVCFIRGFQILAKGTSSVLKTFLNLVNHRIGLSAGLTWLQNGHTRVAQPNRHSSMMPISVIGDLKGGGGGDENEHY